LHFSEAPWDKSMLDAKLGFAKPLLADSQW